jgi:hypothetical protein
MNTRFLHGLQACAILLIANPASADPRHFQLVTRLLASTAQAARCDNSADGYYCLTVYAGDAHDNQRGNLNTSVILIEEGSDSVSGVQFYRSLGCTVPRDTLVTSRTGAALDSSLDTASSDCSSDGFRCDYSVDPAVCEPYVFSGVIAVRGDWQQPIATFMGRTNRQNANSATGESLNFQCQEAGGSLMQAGGFGVGDEFTPFDGRSDPQLGNSFLYGEFLHQSCNSKHE